VITEDEVMRLLERADPARRVDAAPAVDAVGYLDALRTRSIAVTTLDTKPTPNRPPRRRWPIVAVAAAAVVAVVVGGLVLAARDADDPRVPAGPSTTAAPGTAAAEALEIASGILNWRHDDPDRAMSHLTDDLIAEASGNRENYRLEGAMIAALGDKAVNIRCDVQEQSAVGVVVRCTYDQHTFRSEELGRAPFTGGIETVTVRDGTIVAFGASTNPDGVDEYFAETWDRFRQWVTAEYPDDVPVMYEGDGGRLTEESIALWERRTREWAEDQAGVGFIGLPPEGATPSTPEGGEVVLGIQSCLGPSGVPYEIGGWNGELTVLADGRLIWLQYEVLPERANSLSTGLLQQRLTPEGVELMRSELRANGLLNSGDQSACPAGSYHGHLFDGDRRVSHFTSAANEHLARIMDPWSWLPASAWADREIRAFVPSAYAVIFEGETPSSRIRIDFDRLTAQLPAAAKDLLRTHLWDYQQADMFWNYAEFTTDEARALAVALDDARLEQDERLNAYQLQYQFDYHDPSLDTVVHIVFRPLLPNDIESSIARRDEHEQAITPPRT
jgi:hypothetical protein